jgi:polyhydroxybutyrate depolymerase
MLVRHMRTVVAALLFLAVALLAAALAPRVDATERSSGCGLAPPAIPPDSVEVAGTRRSLIVVVPEGYAPERAHRLVLAFHGRTNPAERVRRYYGLEGTNAEADGTIFVYPRALRQGDGTFIWRLPEDLALFDAIVDQFARRYCVAMDQIFAVGHSLGASFVNDLACVRGRVLRGVATVAGGISAADCTGPVAALLLHNPEDRLVPISAGRAALETLLAQNGLSGEPTKWRLGPFSCERFGARGDRNPVLWCLYDDSRTGRGRYYPHQWPEGAAEAVMRFFAALE